MLTRRAFHSLLLASAATAALRVPATAARTANPADLYLNRLTFGATPGARAEFGRLGLEAWLDRELGDDGADDADLARRIADARLRIAYAAGDDGLGASWPERDELSPLSWLNSDPAARVDLLNYDMGMDYALRARPADEVIAASLIRAVHARAQLRELMTQFWHDHFNVAATKDESTAVFFPDYDAMLRRNALGNFRAMLGEMARSPAMLNYLGNSESRASPANENFARELLELHTLGAENYLNDRYPRWHDVPGAAEGAAEGYIDEDVYEVARALTGWTIGDGRWITEGVEAPRTGVFHYAEAWHDPYQKRILGREFPPNRAAMQDGEDVLDMLAAHPGTARHVCGKIARRLLADEPDPGLVARMADEFLAAGEAPDQIARVVRHLVLSPEFAATEPSKLRRPFEFLTACLRGSGAEVASPEAAFRWYLSRAGWRQHEFAPPTGHPDHSANWNNATVIARMTEFALYAHEDWAGIAPLDTGAALPPAARTFGGAVDHWAGRLGADADGPRTIFLDALEAGPDDPLPEDPVERRDLSAIAFAVVAAGPATLLR